MKLKVVENYWEYVENPVEVGTIVFNQEDGKDYVVNKVLENEALVHPSGKIASVTHVEVSPNIEYKEEGLQ